MHSFAITLLLLVVAGCAGGKTTALDRSRSVLLNEQGLEAIQRREWSAAEEHFRAAVTADPFHGPAHCNLGLALLQQQQYAAAAVELQAAAQLMPRASQPRTNLGLLYSAVGRYGAAEVELRAALALDPDDIEIIGPLARVCVRQGRRTPEVLAWLDRIVTQDDEQAWREWARAELAAMHGMTESNQ